MTARTALCVIGMFELTASAALAQTKPETPSASTKFDAEYAYSRQKYADDQQVHNHRVQLSAFYIF